MAAFAGLLFLISIVMLPVGLIKPTWALPQQISKQPTRKLIASIYGGLAFLSILLAGLTVKPEEKSTSTATISSSPEVASSSTAPEAPASPQQAEVSTASKSAESPAASPKAAPVQASPAPASPQIVASEDKEKAITYARNGAGLGDTKANFEKVYGKNSGTEDSGRYQNDYVQTQYLYGVVHNVGVQFGKSSEQRRSIEASEMAAQPFLPDDATRIKAWEHDAQQYVIEYHSNKLANAYPAEMRKWLWEEDGVKPGTIVVILTHDEANPNSTFSVIVSPGDPNNI
jgi:hypothetical protein